MKKLFILLLSLVYLYSSTLIVHAFSMLDNNTLEASLSSIETQKHRSSGVKQTDETRGIRNSYNSSSEHWTHSIVIANTHTIADVQPPHNHDVCKLSFKDIQANNSLIPSSLHLAYFFQKLEFFCTGTIKEPALVFEDWLKNPFLVKDVYIWIMKKTL